MTHQRPSNKQHRRSVDVDGNTRTAEPARPFSRRSLLAATSGLAVAGSALFSGAGIAAPAHSARAPTARSNSNHGDSYSRRAYPVPAAPSDAVDISRDATDLPPPIARSTPELVQVDLETVELEGHLDANTGTRFQYWTFNGQVPGPMLRVRVGDTVEISLTNNEQSSALHNIDLHAVTGPGGGAEATTAAPGETKRVRFKALNPGLYVYHCAVPPVVMHMANGMYGLILVEPEQGLPPVDREFYVMQGEFYTAEAFGAAGLLDASYQKMLDERPEYFVFNGSVGALTARHPMYAKVNEQVRFFFGVGGPNFTSSLHLIGEIFDRVYDLGALPAAPLHNVGTLTVPAGGAAIAEVQLDVPGRYVLVDHAIARVERGLAAWLDVDGPPDPEVFAALSSDEAQNR
ncbi:MAG: nitrite reductase, copper-containing [Hyphomicrobiales bacterium]|nr:nitrite reductase, copper-containing [Hyphomicrobiales bacterium]